MKIKSRWKLTFDPAGTALVLLAFDDLIAGELEWELGRQAEVVPLIGAAAPFLRPMGNNTYQLEVTVYKTGASDLIARTAIMDSLKSIDDLGKKPLRIQVATEDGIVTDRYWQFAQALVRSHKPVREVASSKARYALKYSITATQLTRTNP